MSLAFSAAGQFQEIVEKKSERSRLPARLWRTKAFSPQSSRLFQKTRYGNAPNKAVVPARPVFGDSLLPRGSQAFFSQGQIGQPKTSPSPPSLGRLRGRISLKGAERKQP
jgi:hypothetical protein